MRQALAFHNQVNSLAGRIHTLGCKLDFYERKFCPTCQSWTPVNLTDWELKSVRQRREQRFQELRRLWMQAKEQGMTHKIWKTVGGPSVRASHMPANNQKVRIDEKFKIGNEELFLPSDPSASLAETANCRCEVRYMRADGDNLEGTPRPVRKPTPPDKPTRIMFKLKKPSINVPAPLMTFLLIINSEYHRQTGKVFTITSGPRNPLMQATEMYDDRTDKTYFRRLYVDDLADEIEAAYQKAVKAEKSRQEIIKAMAEAIKAQIARGRYISLHLLGRGVDVRSRDMTSSEQKIFREVAERYAKVLQEGDHWHLEF